MLHLQADLTVNRLTQPGSYGENDMSKLRSTLFKNNRMLFALVLFWVLTGNILSVSFACVLQRIIDLVNQAGLNELISFLSIVAVLLLALFITQCLINWFRNLFVYRAMRSFREEIFSRLSRNNITMFLGDSTSRYISYLSNDASVVEEKYLLGLILLISSVLSMAGAISVMFWYNINLSLIVILLCLLPVIVTKIMIKKISEFELESSDSNNKFIEILNNLLNGFSVIKSFQSESMALKLFDKQNEKMSRSHMVRKNKESLLASISNVLGTAIQISIFVIGGLFAIRNILSVGTVLAYINLSEYIISPLQSIPGYIAGIKSSGALIDNIQNQLSSYMETDGDLAIKELKSGIKIDNLSFSYENKVVLSDLSYNFKSGKAYAIIGDSGSGKSTIMRLLLRGYTSYDGSIFYDDIDIKKATSISLYNTVSYMQQSTFIFNASILDNITMFHDYPDAEVMEAVKKSGLKTLIENKGLLYNCGERGCNLSGGEQQRISIARCLLKKSEVLLMDEATSSLDITTADDIADCIVRLDGVLKIFITHNTDRQFLEKFDQILVLHDGRLTAE